jgi:hypothetical protein
LIGEFNSFKSAVSVLSHSFVLLVQQARDMVSDQSNHSTSD